MLKNAVLEFCTIALSSSLRFIDLVPICTLVLVRTLRFDVPMMPLTEIYKGCITGKSHNYLSLSDFEFRPKIRKIVRNVPLFIKKLTQLLGITK